MSTIFRSYRELSQLRTFLERYEYLALRGEVGQATFGFDRWMNQQFYTSRAWKQVRRDVIVRDEGCDLGILGHEIHDKIIVHHMNPLTEDDVALGRDAALDLDNLICTTHNTHNAIHYGDASLLEAAYVPRRPGDTVPWRKR
jgi:hypothetical protein